MTAEVIEEFFAERRTDGCPRWRTSRSLGECLRPRTVRPCSRSPVLDYWLLLLLLLLPPPPLPLPLDGGVGADGI